MTSHIFLDNDSSKVRLIVRGLEHLAFLRQLLNNPATREYLARYLPVGEKEEEAYLSKPQDANDIAFMIARKPNNTVIGTMGLHRIDWKNRRATTGAIISSKFWGQGYGSDAKMLLLSYAFLELNLNKVESRVYATNLRSQAYSKRCGYKKVGTLRQHNFRNGEFVDEVVMEVLAKDWLPLWEKFKAGKFRPNK